MAAKLYTTEYLFMRYTVLTLRFSVFSSNTVHNILFHKLLLKKTFGSLCKKDRRLVKHLSNYFLDHWKYLIYLYLILNSVDKHSNALLCVHQNKKIILLMKKLIGIR